MSRNLSIVGEKIMGYSGWVRFEYNFFFEVKLSVVPLENVAI